MVAGMTDREEAEFNAGVREARALRARREKWAGAGDVDAIWAQLTRPGADTAELFPLLLKALEARARRHPEQFSGEILARIVSMTTFLALRSHYLLAARIEQFDSSPQGRGRVELPPAFAEKVIPQVLALHGSLAETLHAQATVARVWELTRAKKLENDGAGGKARAKATTKGKAKARRMPISTPANVNGKHNGTIKTHANGEHHGDGKPVNRLAGLLGGLGLNADGVHHDD
ncbi:MAG: hypothetical protein LC745_03115 [Planctomycetia bacterium]|nr:hypothetical protein [Planctomycetia bacterium]